MQIETIGIDRLIPYARNSRTHSDAQEGQLSPSTRELGYTNPVLTDVDVAVRRWQQFTGKRATLESTGAEFPG